MTTPNPKLLITIVNLEGGGAERVVSNLLREFDGWDRHLALFEPEIGYPYEGELHTLDIDLRDGSRPRKVAELTRGTAEMARLKHHIDPDVSLSFLLWPNVLNILSSTRSSERVVASVRNSRSDALLDGNGFVRANGYRMLVEGLYNRADSIISISEGVGRDLAMNFGVSPERLETIYNPVAVSEIRDQAEQPLLEPYRAIFEEPTVVTVGRFVDQKGQWHLIRAFRRVADQREEARLVLLGKGPLEDYLVELSENLGLETWHWQRDPPDTLPSSDVAFVGFRDNPHNFMREASLFAFPSLYEGLGSVLLEALACGTAVVSSDCDFGPREILAPAMDARLRTCGRSVGEYGVLMPTPDDRHYTADDPLTRHEQIWAATLTDLLADDRRRAAIAEAGRRRAEDFRTDAIVDQWEEALL